MANYTSDTSEKSKKTALICWLVGGIGLFGFEYFYVGKIKAGIIKAIIGIFVVLSFVAMKGTDAQIPVGIIFWLIVSIPNLVRLALGVFKDNAGNNLRQ